MSGLKGETQKTVSFCSVKACRPVYSCVFAVFSCKLVKGATFFSLQVESQIDGV